MCTLECEFQEKKEKDLHCKLTQGMRPSGTHARRTNLYKQHLFTDCTPKISEAIIALNIAVNGNP